MQRHLDSQIGSTASASDSCAGFGLHLVDNLLHSPLDLQTIDAKLRGCVCWPGRAVPPSRSVTKG